jgi:hypothetical protein
MSQSLFEKRRLALQSAAALTLTSLASKLTDLVPAAAAAEGEGAPAEAAKPAAGKPGDFDFLAGEWRIQHRRLKSADEWDEFEGEATCFTILGGVGSVEELRIPARNFSGMGLRLLDVGAQVWNDYWVNAASGVLSTPGQSGHFQDGVGTFSADDVDGDQPIKVRGVWDRITPTSCRWHQAVSRDGGRTWDVNWTMDWHRA